MVHFRFFKEIFLKDYFQQKSRQVSCRHCDNIQKINLMTMSHNLKVFILEVQSRIAWVQKTESEKVRKLEGLKFLTRKKQKKERVEVGTHPQDAYTKVAYFLVIFCSILPISI